MPEASLPDPGSVSPHAPIHSPEVSFGSHSFLRVVAGEVDVAGAQRIVRGHGEADPAVDDGELLDDVDVVDVRQTGAAVLLGENRAQHPELTELLHHLGRKGLGLIPLHHVRLDFALREILDALLDLNLFFGEAEIHSRLLV